MQRNTLSFFRKSFTGAKRAFSTVQLTAAQTKLQLRARKFAEEVVAPTAAETDRSGQYPFHVVEELTKEKFMGMTIPKEYGGQGLSIFDAHLVVEEIARHCGVSARIVSEASMGGIGAVMMLGTEDQKQMAAENVLKGDKPAMLITEPGAGSAAGGMKTRADFDGSHYILNGTKHWITGGGVSKLYLIFARVFDGPQYLGIAAFMAQLGDEGLIIGPREETMGLRGMPEAKVMFDDLAVPVENALILDPSNPQEMSEQTLAISHRANTTRRIGATTVALGIAQGAYDLAVKYLGKRTQFGRPLCEFQGLQWMTADMHVQLEAARMLVRECASPGDDFPNLTKAARAKIFTSEMAIKVTNDALQMFGAKGYSTDIPLERMVRDARVFTINSGTNQILRTGIAQEIFGRTFQQAQPPPKRSQGSQETKKQSAQG